MTYVHTQASVGLDWRPAPGYARRGGFYAITAHDYNDRDSKFGFRQVDYEVVQHVPILRDAWVISLRGLAETAFRKDGQDIPYFLLPHLGGGSTLRGFDSWRFRDTNRLLLQAEWRIMVNRFIDTAVFYDAGKVTARHSDLDFDGLKTDYGFGARFHTPFQTSFRVEVARSRETTRLIFSTSPVF
jgi:outer membrane translocation and assembly module TamA